MISGGEPHAPCGCERLRGAFAAPRCGARRRGGGSCLQPAMPNGRCRLHGGKSTGPVTAAGKERSRLSGWRHGHYTKEAVAERRAARQTLREAIRALRDYRHLI
ncbi:HGGxSTG domain-containing protein [Methylobacterium sp. A54F]